MAYCQTSINSYFRRRKKNRVGSRNPATTKSTMWQGCPICFWKDTKEFNRHTGHSKKLLSLLGHLKAFNLKALKTLKSSWKQEKERAQPQAPTGRNCTCFN